MIESFDVHGKRFVRRSFSWLPCGRNPQPAPQSDCKFCGTCRMASNCVVAKGEDDGERRRVAMRHNERKGQVAHCSAICRWRRSYKINQSRITCTRNKCSSIKRQGISASPTHLYSCSRLNVMRHTTKFSRRSSPEHAKNGSYNKSVTNPIL